MRRRSKDPLPEVLNALKDSRGAALIYVRTRRSVEHWANLLKTKDFVLSSLILRYLHYINIQHYNDYSFEFSILHLRAHAC